MKRNYTDRTITFSNIAAFIPAYNEARGIVKILEVLIRADYLNEIIVINDGSTDDTEILVRNLFQYDPRVKIITHLSNRGKGEAVLSALKTTDAQYIMTLDADLVGFQLPHVYDLIQPLLEDVADMTIGIFKGGQWNTDISHWFAPWLSGQRCLRAELLRQISWKAAAGYGLETAITVASRQQRWRCVKVSWKGVSHPSSEFHRGLFLGAAMRIRMYTQILRAWFIAVQERSPIKNIPQILCSFFFL